MKSLINLLYQCQKMSKSIPSVKKHIDSAIKDLIKHQKQQQDKKQQSQKSNNKSITKQPVVKLILTTDEAKVVFNNLRKLESQLQEEQNKLENNG